MTWICLLRLTIAHYQNYSIEGVVVNRKRLTMSQCKSVENLKKVKMIQSMVLRSNYNKKKYIENFRILSSTPGRTNGIFKDGNR